MKILIVEDEPELLKNIVKYLQFENFLCETASDYQSAHHKITTFDYDCILMDVTLPGGNGLDLLNELKRLGKTEGVIIISARDSIDDRVKGLELGADDYLIKPFHFSEMNARVSAVIRRRHLEGKNIIVINNITIDFPAKTVHVENTPVDLTKSEFDLLLFLAINKNRVISKNSISEHLLGSEINHYGNYDFLYTHIKNLKRKLVQAGAKDCIKSMYGSGYKLEVLP
jgi:DNA-binding response OmpR family regulator